MMRKLGLAATALAAWGALAATAQAADRCDRACLEGFVDRTIAAMAAHRPGDLPWAARARFTENGQALAVGDALWATASAPGHYRLYVADPEAGQVGYLGTVFENGVPVLIALRLKIEDQTIAEAEQIVARPGGGTPFGEPGKTLEGKGQPRAQFLRTVPTAERMDRADLVRVADSYFTGLAANTGRNTAPFAPTCERWENGAKTNSNPGLRPARPGGVDIIALGCDAQQRSGFFAFVSSIRNRRFPIVDRERGLVMSFAFFEHAGRLQTIHLANGQDVPSPIRAPTTYQIAELFQIDRGRIDQVEAALIPVPYGMISDAWDRK